MDTLGVTHGIAGLLGENMQFNSNGRTAMLKCLPDVKLSVLVASSGCLWRFAHCFEI